MRISELSKRSGVPIATIKFYLRERLLPPGHQTAWNQAEYDDTHLTRLRLIRVFTSIGGLDLSCVQMMLGAIDDEGLSLRELHEVVDLALLAERAVLAEADGVERARVRVDHYLDNRGWKVEPDAPGRGKLAQTLAAFQRLGCDYDVDIFAPYADAAERLAAQELDQLPGDDVVADRAAEVVKAVLFEVALGAMRRMAQEHYLAVSANDDQPLGGDEKNPDH